MHKNADSTDDALSALEPKEPFRFVPAEADLGSREQVVGLYERLLALTVDCESELEEFVLLRSELEAAVHQRCSILYIRMTCQTDDPSRAQAYRHFIEDVQPVVGEMTNRLDKKYLDLRKRFSSGGRRYEVYVRNHRTDAELYRPQNIPLLTKDELCKQQYQQITGSMSVKFRDGEYTPEGMRIFLQDQDRDTRKEAWLALANCRARQTGPLGELFSEMLKLRHQSAVNAGMDNYVLYKFRQYHRFDYLPADCRRYHQAVEDYIVPLQKQVWRHRSEQMGIERPGPWDLTCDPLGRPALVPFENGTELLVGLKKIFARLDGQLSEIFDDLVERGLIDIMNRKGKAPGGYQCTLDLARKPFIFANATGLADDLRTMLHESGHAFHAALAGADALLDYRHSPMEFAEVASMTMELLAMPYLTAFFSQADMRRWRRIQIENAMRILVSVAANDAFQHRLYENPEHTDEQRNDMWVELQNRFGQDALGWAGLEEHRRFMWQAILHFYQVPLYYIDYGIAQLASLNIWKRSQTEPSETLAIYKKALCLGGSRPLPELFEAAGVLFDFSEKTIAPLSEFLRKEWQEVCES